MKGGTSTVRIGMTETPVCGALHHHTGILHDTTCRIKRYNSFGDKTARVISRSRSNQSSPVGVRVTVAVVVIVVFVVVATTVVVGTRRRQVGGVRTAGRRADWRRRRDG